MISTEYIYILSKLMSFLKFHEVNYAAVIEKYLIKFESANTENQIKDIVEEARQRIFSGMGSLNDIWISKENGHNVDNEKIANIKLEQLRQELRNILFRK